MTHQLRLLTYNVGLLRIAVLGRTLLEVPHSAARFAQLVPALRADDADVLCLQEVFRRSHRESLVEAMRGSHPYAARHDDRRRGLTHGLLTLSRHPLTETRFLGFGAQVRWQRLLVRQGVLDVTVQAPGFGPLRVLNAHAAAGGPRGPERAGVERLRDRQLREVDAIARQTPLPTLVCGDLNTGPEASPAGFRAMLARGYVDAFVQGGGCGTTWDPANELNRGGLFGTSPRQRVDHVLLDEAAASACRVTSAEVVHTDRVVDADGVRTTLSDHYGVLVTLRTSDAPSAVDG